MKPYTRFEKQQLISIITHDRFTELAKIYPQAEDLCGMQCKFGEVITFAIGKENEILVCVDGGPGSGITWYALGTYETNGLTRIKRVIDLVQLDDLDKRAFYSKENFKNAIFVKQRNGEFVTKMIKSRQYPGSGDGMTGFPGFGEWTYYGFIEILNEFDDPIELSRQANKKEPNIQIKG